MFNNLREDWQTYERDIWRQGLWVMVVYRFGRWRYRIRPSWLRKPFSLMYKLLRTTSQVMAIMPQMTCTACRPVRQK